MDKKRALILSTAVIFGFFLVVVRLADLMLLSHKRLSEKAKFQHEDEIKVPAYRGAIYDRRGRELAVNLDTDSLYCNPNELDSPEKAAALLSGVTGEDAASIMKKISTGKSFIWVKRKLDIEKAEEIKRRAIKGVGFVPEVRRFYPKGALAAHVIGFVGVDNQSLGGIEYKYEETLKGKTEKLSVSKDAGGRSLSEGLVLERPGNSLVLTIDEGLQYIVEDGLDQAINKWRAASATAVMLDPFTGEVLAMASRPAYNPNDPLSSGALERRNRSVTDTYEPGSTFKIVTAAGVIEKKLVNVDTKFDCSAGRLKISGMTIKDVHKKGVLTFREVIQTSSNIGTVMAATRLGNGLYEYAKRFGFGEFTGVDLPGESAGAIKPPSEWSGTTLPAMSMGYEVAVTPLQVVRAYSVIANGGFLVRPHVVLQVITPEGELLYGRRMEKPVRVLSRETADTLKKMLESVTEEGGTAHGASVDGNKVAGKTGTSKLLEGGKYSNKYVSSFVGFVPAENPRVALIVVIREPKGQYYGGMVAAPAFKDIAERSLAYLNVPREDTPEDNVLVVQAKDAFGRSASMFPKVEDN